MLYLDNHLCIVNKPCGLLSQSDPSGDPDLLSLTKEFIRSHFNKPGDAYLGLVSELLLTKKEKGRLHISPRCMYGGVGHACLMYDILCHVPNGTI